jgi:peroxiredoxin
MTTMWQKLAAGTEFPTISVWQLGGGELELGKPQGNCDWQLVVVYRGKHCPICSNYLKQLQPLVDGFREIGVDVVVVSGDPEEKASAHMAELGVDLTVGYGLRIEQMRELGLYISHPRSPEETDRPFPEPGVFVVNADGRLQIVDISNAPFARPQLESLLGGLQWIRDPDNNYPIRGTYD